MAKPFVRYINTVRPSIIENNGSFEHFTVYIRDKSLVSDWNIDFKSEGGFKIDYPTNDNEPQDVFFGSNCTIKFLVENNTDQTFINALISDQEERFYI